MFVYMFTKWISVVEHVSEFTLIRTDRERKCHEVPKDIITDMETVLVQSTYMSKCYACMN